MPMTSSPPPAGTPDDGSQLLTQLGRNTTQPASPEDAILERVPAPDADRRYVVRFTAPEFTDRKSVV